MGVWRCPLEGLVVMSRFWSGKKVFVTGATGFKGSWVSLALSSMGAEVMGFSLSPPSEPSLFVETNSLNGSVHVDGDIRDTEKLKAAIFCFEPDVILHMAAQSLVRPSYEDPIETISTNVIGTASVMWALKDYSKKSIFINVTSDKCYENREWAWGYREIDPMGGYDPYSASKGCAELIFGSFSRSFFTDSAIFMATVRAGNVIGGGDWAKDRLIPDIVRSFVKSEKVEIRSPKATRPWQHVLEPVFGYLFLAEKLYEDSQFQGAWNFGPGEDGAKTVGDVVQLVCEKWGGEAGWVDKSATDQPHEAKYLKLDCSKAHSALRWKPVLSCEEAIQLTVDWYKSYYEKGNALEVTQQQIQFYLDRRQL